MIYLFLQIWIWLLLAMLLGLAIGWLFWGKARQTQPEKSLLLATEPVQDLTLEESVESDREAWDLYTDTSEELDNPVTEDTETVSDPEEVVEEISEDQPDQETGEPDTEESVLGEEIEEVEEENSDSDDSKGEPRSRSIFDYP